MFPRYRPFQAFIFLLLAVVVTPCFAAPVQSVSASLPTGLDISLAAGSSGYTFYSGISPTWGNLQPGGFVQYNLAFAAPGTYAVTMYYSTTLQNQSANLLVNGVQQAAAQLPATQSWGNPQNSAPVTVQIPAGGVSLTIAAVSNSPAFNLQGLTLTPVKSAASLPVQAVNPASPTGLDISLVSAFNNYTLYRGTPSLWGNLQSGGFIEYTLSTSHAANYSLNIYFSTVLNGMTANVLVNGSSSGTVSLPSTASWSTFQNSAPVSLALPAGTFTLRIAAAASNPAFNIAGLTLAPIVAANSPGPTQAYPLAGKKLYVNPYTVSAVNPNACAASYPSTPQLMTKIASQPQAVWFGSWNTNVAADAANLMSLAAAQQALPTIVVYNIPDRDCAGGYSSGGADYASYQSWIKSLAQGLGSAKSAIILEPDALSQIEVCGLNPQQQQDRYNLLTYAVSTFKTYSPNALIYLDAGHSDDSILPADMAQRLQNAGVSAATGFALNTSYYGTTASNVTYGQSIAALLNNKHFVVDTGRNGNGPTPDAQWCNPSGRALGARPTAFTSGLVDAYLWVKNPGESDGTCNGGPAAGQFFPQMACTLANNAAW